MGVGIQDQVGRLIATPLRDDNQSRVAETRPPSEFDGMLVGLLILVVALGEVLVFLGIRVELTGVATRVMVALP